MSSMIYFKMNSEMNNEAIDGTIEEVCCRVCLQLEDLMVHLYDDGVIDDLQSDLITLLEQCGGIEVQRSDNLPKFLCKECATELLVAAKFREKCKRAQRILSLTAWKVSQNVEEPPIIESGSVKDEDIHSCELEAENGILLLNMDYHSLEVDPQEFVNISSEENGKNKYSLNEPIERGINIQNLETISSNCENSNFSNGSRQNFQTIELFDSIIEEESFSIIAHSTCDQEISQSCVPQDKLEKYFTCDSCGAVFLQATNLQRHLKKSHLIMQPYCCLYCSHTFALQETYMNHSLDCKKSHDRISSPKPSPAKYKFEKTATQSTKRECDYCGKQMQSNFALKMHLRTHTGERPYKCMHCPKAFKTQSACSMHVKRHSEKPEYSCSLCNKTFYESSNLTAHMRTHTGEKPHSCTFCQKRFSRVFLLQLHMRTHTGEKPYQCQTCNRSFAQLCDLRNHERIHTGERRFKCSICGRTFIKKYSLKSHMARHTELQPEQTTAPDEQNIVSTQLKKKEVHDVNHMLESDILEGDSYFLSKGPEDPLVNLTYEEVPALSESNPDLMWSDFIIEEI